MSARVCPFVRARSWRFGSSVLISAMLIFSSQFALAQFTQQGPKLVGTFVPGDVPVQQGYSVALSGDGDTAIVGGPYSSDAGEYTVGAAWIFTRNGGVWTQQGGRLEGNDVAATRDPILQGYSVALSADGDTAVVGGPGDNNNYFGIGVGAGWVYTRNGGIWTQEGPKLVGNDVVGNAGQGWSVAVSADGNTAVVGGPCDATIPPGCPGLGATWVYTRAGGVWTQQGPKLVGSGAIGAAQQGSAVALSGDGNTAIVSGPSDNSGVGAVWVFTRSGGVWTQQGNKLVLSVNSLALSADGNTAVMGGSGMSFVYIRTGGAWTQQGPVLVGTGAIGASDQGYSVGITSDGNTAIVGGPDDNSGAGAAWLFARNGGNWTQRGDKLVGTGAVGMALQGWSVALSGDGNTAIVGGTADASNGASWVYIRTVPTNTHDYNDEGYSDIVWRDSSGDVAFWLMGGATVSSSAAINGIPSAWSLVGQRDFNGDGKADLLWRDTGGDIAMWFMNATAVASTVGVGNVPTHWSVAGVADFNGDGYGDLLWRDTSGNIAMWLMNGATVMTSAALGNVPTTWTVVGTGDFNGDGTADILWQDNLGDTAIWFMNGTTVASGAGIGNIPNWSMVGTGDFNGDGKTDIVWRDTAGDTAIWLMNGATISSASGIGTIPTTWSIVQTGDYNGDGMSDLLWRDTSGNTAIWFMDGTTIASTAGVGNIPTIWTVQSANAE
jgi:hypothetical protein